MKHSHLDLNKMSLVPMTFEEMLTIDGGNFWKWLAAGVVAVAAVVVGLTLSFAGGEILAVCAAGLGVWALITGEEY